MKNIPPTIKPFAAPPGTLQKIHSQFPSIDLSLMLLLLPSFNILFIKLNKAILSTLRVLHASIKSSLSVIEEEILKLRDKLTGFTILLICTNEFTNTIHKKRITKEKFILILTSWICCDFLKVIVDEDKKAIDNAINITKIEQELMEK